MSKQHARYSPSQLENLEACLRFKFKPMEDAAGEGTMLHKSAESRDYKGLDEEQRSAVEGFVGYGDNLKAAFGGQPVYDICERKVELKELTWGTADRVIVCGPVAHVMDFKPGRKGSTEAKDNMQLKTYCGALMEELEQVTSCTGHIFAPRAAGQGVSSHTFDRSLVQEIRSQIEALYARIDNPFLPPCGEDPELCSVCARANCCPVVSTTAVTVARGIGLPLPESFLPGAIISDDDRGRAQAVATALENWAEQVKEANKAHAEGGGAVFGYEYKRKSSGKKVPADNVPAAINRLIAAGYANLEQLLPTLTMSLPKIVEAMKFVRGETEAEEKERLYTVLSDLVVEGGYKYLQRVKKVVSDQQLLTGKE